MQLCLRECLNGESSKQVTQFPLEMSQTGDPLGLFMLALQD